MAEEEDKIQDVGDITWGHESREGFDRRPFPKQHTIHIRIVAIRKTTLILQLLFEISHKTAKPVLFYDTEGGAQQFIDEWEPIYKKKYPRARIDVRVRRNAMKILLDHGYDMILATSGDGKVSREAKAKTSGKYKLKTIDISSVSPMSKLCNKEKYSAIFYDSFTMPFGIFGPNQENFPARGQAQSTWLHGMMDLIDEYGLSIFVSHHSSKNPTDIYAKELMSGGKAAQHHSKVILALLRYTGKAISTYRRLQLVRYFNKAPFSSETLVKLTDEGYVDAKESDMEDDKKAAKKTSA